MVRCLSPRSTAPSGMTAASALILVIDDDTQIRYSLSRVLTARQFEVLEAANGRDGIALAEKRRPAVVFLDNRMEGMSGLETLQHLRSVSPTTMVIMMTAFGTTQTAIEAMKFGAFDYIVKPFDVKKVLSLVEGASQAHQDLLAAKGGYAPLINSDDYKEGIVGSSEAMRQVFKVIGQVAASEVTVMVTGESGTGKELVARCLYQHSLRAEKPFIAVNCAAIPDNLIESELFGHERGSFTGATNQRLGKFELCDGGTIFLDEIGDMALSTQTKILRALQEGEIQRVGGTDTIKVDVRLIAATNKDLEKMVQEKTFREDLYYRLNVVRVRLPALRERLDDVPQLVDYMLQRMAKERRGRIKRISSEALDVLVNYRWPGNVRELENVITRAAVVAQGEMILLKDLPHEVVAAVPESLRRSPSPAGAKAAPAASEAELIGTHPPPPPPPLSAPASTPVAARSAPAEPTVSQPAPAPSATPATDLGGLLDRTFAALHSAHGEDILSVIEKEFTIRALRETGGNQVRTAALLGMTRATLRKRQEEWNLRV